MTAPYDRVRLTAWLTGRVQGVGMRWSVRARALELGLAGWARNMDDGRVEVVAEGDRAAAEALLATLRAAAGGQSGGSSSTGLPGRITAVVERWSEAAGVPEGFRER